ncbi:hypothetical protein D3C76_1239780 [compost metagenome]
MLAWQLGGNTRQFERIGRPVLPAQAIAAADGANQPAVPIEQADRHAIHLRLHPEIVAAAQPFLHGGWVGQLVEAGMGNRMAQRSGTAVERVGQGGRLLRKAVAPLVEAGAGLVVEFVGDRRDALAMVGVVPVRQLLAQRGQFGAGLVIGPVGAGGGERRAGEEGEGEEEALHDRHPCGGRKRSA